MDNETIANIDNSIETLDSEIAKIRQEINNFQNRRRLLSASLLSSDYVHQRIEQSNSKRDGGTSATVPRSVREEVSSLLSNAQKHRLTNLHRLAFGTTTFPWKDPNPYSDCPNLLGIRIDISERSGAFSKPYYVLLRREKEGSASSSSSLVQRQRRSTVLFSIYRHTIPTFIPMEKLAHRYLPQPRPIRKRGEADDEIETLKAKAKTRKQDLSAFVRQLRKEIAAWHVRRDSISWLQERMGITTSAISDGDEGISEQEETRRQRNNHAAFLVSLAATSLECRYVRLEWRDGRVGRFKISNSGLVERAVVIDDRGRDKRTETILMGGDRRVETLVDRLLST